MNRLQRNEKRTVVILIVCLLIFTQVFIGCGLFDSMVSTAFAQSLNLIRPTAGGKITVPTLLITEIVTMTVGASNGNTSNDAFEYIEVYNNTNRPIDFSDYKVIYRYPAGPDSDLILTPDPENIIIQPGRTLVLWGQNESNVNETVESFNSHFGTSLVENEDIVKIDMGLHSSRTRWIIVATNTGHEIVSAVYNDGVRDSSQDQGILYRYPDDGSIEMVKYSSAEKRATPGVLEPGQVPEKLLSVKADRKPPVIRNMTQQESPPGLPIEIVAEAQDDQLLKTFKLYYRTESQSPFIEQLLRQDQIYGQYRHQISVMDVIGKETVEYYFTASDGTNVITSEIYSMLIRPSDVSPRINVEPDDVVSGTRLVKAAANGYAPDEICLLIDGVEADSAYLGLEEPAFFVFEAHGMDNNFHNTVRMNGDILKLIDYRIYDFQEIVIPVEGIRTGSNTISIAAGSKSGPYDGQPHDNLDDFDVRNIRLLLADGTEIKDPQYGDPTLKLDMGDNGRYLPVVDFSFTVPEDKASAKMLQWDTTALPDGMHRIEAVTPDHKHVAAGIIADNHGPVIEATVEEGTSYKGPFTIDASAEDIYSGMASLSALLDGRPIELPYATSSALLSPGEHELVLQATDQAENLSKSTIRFMTADEHPSIAEVVYPSDGAVELDTDVTLAVKVCDPDSDPLRVTFYQGHQYDASCLGNITWFTGRSGTEPPISAHPEGERQLTEREIDDIVAVDNRYLTLDSETGFPYLRMEVEIDSNIRADDKIEIHWEGRSLPGRKVTLYAWNVHDEKWTEIDAHTSEADENFELGGKIPSDDFLDNQILNVIIQDELARDQEDQYTFVWMSDSQYYTQTLSHVMQTQVDWIVENKEALNIQYVFHTGDIVENAHQEYQWRVADRLISQLEEADIPIGVLAGNHDVLPDNDYSMYSKYFGAFRYENKPYYGESYKDNRGHYDLISVGGNDYVMVYMGWGAGKEEIEWLNKVLAEHPDRKAILSFHDYLGTDGQRSATGNDLFEKVVVPNSNVIMVLSGHYTGAALKIDELDDDGDGIIDRKVFQVLSDYQGHGEGGDGYMKLLHIDPSSGMVHVETYSPYKDDFNYYDPSEYPWADEYSLPLNLQSHIKRVATDFVQVNVFTSKSIGGVAHVNSGQTAQAKWKSLSEGETYSWYVEARDRYGGNVVSDLWTFSIENSSDLPNSE